MAPIQYVKPLTSSLKLKTWLDLYRSCYGISDYNNVLPSSPPDLPTCDFSVTFPAYLHAYNRLYSIENPVFAAHYIADPDQIRCVLLLYVAAAIIGTYRFGNPLAQGLEVK
eukprot:scaffold102071_cov66-Cyclotella_meneghiniana.AAC.2